MRDIHIKLDAYHAPLYHKVKREVDPFHLLPSRQWLQYILSRTKLLQSQDLTSHSWSILLPRHGTQHSPSHLMLDWLGPSMNYGGVAVRSCGWLRCYWVATQAVDRLDKEIAGSQAVIKDVVDSGHFETMYLHPQVASACACTCKPCSIFNPSLLFVAHLGHVLTWEWTKSTCVIMRLI